jgi:hypothetical protein
LATLGRTAHERSHRKCQCETCFEGFILHIATISQVGELRNINVA